MVTGQKIDASTLRSGDTVTLTLEKPGTHLVRCEVNPDAPREPTRPRDLRGRFTRRTGVVSVVGSDSSIWWTVTPEAER